MPSANLDLVRSILSAWERGDFSQAAEWAHPEIEFVYADGPSPGTWKGLAGMAQSFGDSLGAWEDYRVIGDEYRELDDERVLALVHRSGRGKTSRAVVGEMAATGAGVFHVCEGRVTKLVTYWDRERALADLGLRPEGDSQR
jgi:ketosteroid isomerase-like protein